MLDFLFNPKSIAVIGASRKKGRVGRSILENIIFHGYKGKVYPVNPKAKKILGLRCYSSVKEIKDPVDLAIIVIPAAVVPAVLEECGQKEIPGVIIISAGFKEIGGKGIKLERKISEVARRHNIKLLGPNCLGIMNRDINLNASFGQGFPKRGNISLISQSGAMVAAITDWADTVNLGFSKIVSMGNKTGIKEDELLRYLGKDKNTKVIIMYLENIENGQRFIEIARKVSFKKPIIAIKSGVTEKGKAGVSSHTGALAGSNQAVKVAFKKCRIIRANTIEDLFNLSKAFSWQPLLRTNKIAILTNAGGPAIMATDALEHTGIDLAKFESRTTRFLKTHLLNAADIKNPVDIIGDALADRYEFSLDTILRDKNIAGTIVILTPQTMTQEDKTAETISRISRKYKNKPILTSFMGGKEVLPGIEILDKNHIPNFIYPERAVKTLNLMWRYKVMKDRLKTGERSQRVILSKKDKDKLSKIINNAKRQLCPLDVQKVLNIYEISQAKSHIARSCAEACKVVESIGYPVVLKVISQDLLHKTDIGGVKINLKSKSEVKKACYEILNSVRKNKPRIKIDGILVQEMIKDGQEVILGMKRDPQFGPLLMFGLGGIYVEVLKDVSFGLAPLSRREAQEMIHEIKTFKILKGVRGQKSVDIKAIENCLLNLSNLSLDFPKIKEIDINPLIVKERGAVAVDARIIVG